MSKTTPLAAREALGLRQEDVASKAHLSLSTVVRCERDGRWPRSFNDRTAYLAALCLTESDIAPKRRRVLA